MITVIIVTRSHLLDWPRFLLRKQVFFDKDHFVEDPITYRHCYEVQVVDNRDRQNTDCPLEMKVTILSMTTMLL